VDNVIRNWLFVLIATLLVGCAIAPGDDLVARVEQEPDSPVVSEVPGETATMMPEVELVDQGPAPELENEVWLNVDGPLRLADLRGKVVLLEMWTFG
jgi:hypothetical protein